MDQETGIRPLYAEFFWGYGIEIDQFRPEFTSNWTHKGAYTIS